MTATVRQIIAIAATAVMLWVGYYGSYLPLRKSQIFIEVVRSDTAPNSLEDLESRMARPLDYFSPIGQGELVRNSASSILGLIRQLEDKKAIASLIGFIEQYYAPIIAKPRGMSFGQDLYILGAMNELALVKTREAGYLEKARSYFGRSIELAPRRPQSLYGVFDTLRFQGDMEGARKIGEQILSQWPQDETTRKAITEMLEKSLTNKK